MTAKEISGHINSRETVSGARLKHTWSPAQVVQFLYRSPLFYPDPECDPYLRPDGKRERRNPLWFIHPLGEVVRSLASKTHVRTAVKSHPKFLRDALEEYQQQEST